MVSDGSMRKQKQSFSGAEVLNSERRSAAGFGMEGGRGLAESHNWDFERTPPVWKQSYSKFITI